MPRRILRLRRTSDDQSEAATEEAADFGTEVPNVLVIGPLPPPVGGATVLTGLLVDFMSEASDINAVFVDSSAGAGSRLRRKAERFTVPFRIARRLPSVRAVTVHLSNGGVWTLGLATVLLSKMAGRPVIVRRFGGAPLLSSGWVRRSCDRWVLRNADVVFVETARLVAEGERIGRIDVRQFPNSRPLPEIAARTVRSNGDPFHFVYVGHIRSEKGIRELISAGERLGPAASVDVYGPLAFDIDIAEFDNLERVHYCGVLAPDAVPSALMRYDALVMPSHYEGEGHPGVIVEAYGAGVPVIATRWISIPEIVDESSGVLVEPFSNDDLLRGMLDLANGGALHERLAEGTRGVAERMDSAHWNRYFVDRCLELIGEG